MNSVEWIDFNRITRRDDFLAERHDPKRVERILKKFDPNKVRPGKVNVRPDGTIVQIDGHHTSDVLIARGEAGNYFTVLRGLTEQQEAAEFAHQLDDVVRLHNTKIFMMEVSAGQSPAKEIYELVGDRIRVTKTSGTHGSERIVNSASALKTIYCNCGPEILDRVVEVISKRWTCPSGTQGTILEGLAEFMVRAPEYDFETLVEALRDTGQGKLIADAENRPGKGRSKMAHESRAYFIMEQITHLYNRVAEKKVYTGGTSGDKRSAAFKREVRKKMAS